jgi:large repetitive protein
MLKVTKIVNNMQTHITPNNKLASLGTIGLLFLAGVAGMVFLLPLNSAHAASPTVTVSTISSGVLTAATAGAVGTTLVVTGTGFTPASPITITTLVGTTTVGWLTIGSCATTNSGASSASPAVDSLVVLGCLTTTAVGNFQVEVAVPNLPSGAQTVSVSDGTLTGTASFTVNPSITITYTGNNYGFPLETITPSITVSGFGASESVTISTTMWTTASFSCPTGTTGTCTIGGTTQVAETTGGVKTITATGATSALTTTATYTVYPWAAFYTGVPALTAFSFIGAAPTSLYVEAHGLAATTVPSASITIGGAATNHQSITPGSSGSFYHVVVAPLSQVPYGAANVVVGGTTFSYAAGNILSTLLAATPTVNYWGGALISSVQGSVSSTGVVSTDAANYKPGAVANAATLATTSAAPPQNQMGFFGYGFGAGSTETINTPPGAVFAGTVVKATDANGAFFLTPTLSDTPWSSAATPTTANSYTAIVGSAGGTVVANILSPSFGITPWIDTSKGGITTGATSGLGSTSTTIDYTYFASAKVHGFSASETVTLTIGGKAMISGGTIVVSGTGFGTTAAGQVPDLAGGAQNAVATGTLSSTTVSATGAVKYDPLVGPTSIGQALSQNSGGAGTVSTLRTGVGYGVHGLLANTAYNVVWNAISGSSTVGTFTSTATGGIPIPGTQFTVPSDSSGIHILDIQTAAGNSAIFGSLKLGEIIPVELPFSGTYTTGYGDLLFTNVALLQASPSVALIGSPETLSGSGLTAGGSYVVTLSTSSSNVAPTNSPALAVFTATSTGNVPSGTAITLADTPTKLETGSVMYLDVQTAAHFGVAPYPADAYAQFVLAASASLNMTTAPAGHPVILTAHALNAVGAVYNIVFNYVQSQFQSNSYTGTTVGIIAPNSVGAGSATFNVPASATTGTYVVQLVVSTQGTNGNAVGTAILNSPLTLTVGTPINVTGCTTTSCLTFPTSTTQIIGPNKFVVTSFTNTSNGPVTAIVYAVVHNAAGQTVAYSTATLNAVAAGGSQAAYNVLFGLAPGTYSVTIFATSTSGTAISTSSPVSVTV